MQNRPHGPHYMPSRALYSWPHSETTTDRSRLLTIAVTTRDDGNGKPVVVRHYNTHMGGVDQGDMLMSFYNAGQKQLRK
ncbi:hypothetical protein MAR_011961 [Mya arenaria]|uniref:Uncharacterized protein n=1 Tax=Mya arenaria TaxID=6604 RepID=A0ABY7FVR4_MYAAR|nr:hypothetical protein MAR_011961 [Mya arenaria]